MVRLSIMLSNTNFLLFINQDRQQELALSSKKAHQRKDNSLSKSADEKKVNKLNNKETLITKLNSLEKESLLLIRYVSAKCLGYLSKEKGEKKYGFQF